MRTLYIGFSKSKKKFPILSWLIRWYLKREYSHTYMEIDHKRLFGVNTIYHSAGKVGVTYFSKPVFLEKNKEVALYEWSLPDTLYREIRTETHKELGKSYGTMQNIGIALVDLYIELFKRKVKNPFRKGSNCSEAIFRALLKQFPELSKKYNPNTIKPSHIEEILIDKEFKRIL